MALIIPVPVFVMHHFFQLHLLCLFVLQFLLPGKEAFKKTKKKKALDYFPQLPLATAQVASFT